MNGEYPIDGEYDSMPPLPYPTSSASSLEPALIEKLDPSSIIEKIRHALKGEIENPETGSWEKRFDQMCDDKLINLLLMNAASVINQNTTMSELNDHEIGSIIYDLSLVLINLLAQTADLYHVDYSKLDTIWTTISNTAYLALKRAKNRGEMRALRTVIRSQEQVAVHPSLQQEKKRKFLVFGGK